MSLTIPYSLNKSVRKSSSTLFCSTRQKPYATFPSDIGKLSHDVTTRIRRVFGENLQRQVQKTYIAQHKKSKSFYCVFSNFLIIITSRIPGQSQLRGWGWWGCIQEREDHPGRMYQSVWKLPWVSVKCDLQMSCSSSRRVGKSRSCLRCRECWEGCSSLQL